MLGGAGGHEEGYLVAGGRQAGSQREQGGHPACRCPPLAAWPTTVVTASASLPLTTPSPALLPSAGAHTHPAHRLNQPRTARLSRAAAPRRAGLAGGPRRAALRPCRTAPTRQRPARRLCCQSAASQSVADVMVTGIGVGLTLNFIGPRLLRCGQKIVQRLLPRLADKHRWGEAAPNFTTLCAIAGVQHDSSQSNLYYALEIFAAAALCCLVEPTILLALEFFRRQED